MQLHKQQQQQQALRQGSNSSMLLQQRAARVMPQRRQHHPQRRHLPAAAAASAAAAANASAPPSAVVTREAGKNGKLSRALAAHGVECVELPLIEHAPGPQRGELPGLLRGGGFDWVAVTSPEAAAVFVEGWRAAGEPDVRVAVVGGGTGDALRAAGVTPAFTATKALGKVMGAELPRVPAGSNTVLYPASVRASTDLQDSLTAAGFSVTRLDTYDTVGVAKEGVDAALLARALAADVVTFGSPSAVKAWVALVGLEAAKQRTCVCIGSTSARACAAAGLERVVFPDSPGVDAWADCALAALRQAGRLPAAAGAVA